MREYTSLSWGRKQPASWHSRVMLILNGLILPISHYQTPYPSLSVLCVLSSLSWLDFSQLLLQSHLWNCFGQIFVGHLKVSHTLYLWFRFAQWQRYLVDALFSLLDPIDLMLQWQLQYGKKTPEERDWKTPVSSNYPQLPSLHLRWTCFHCKGLYDLAGWQL